MAWPPSGPRQSWPAHKGKPTRATGDRRWIPSGHRRLETPRLETPRCGCLVGVNRTRTTFVRGSHTTLQYCLYGVPAVVLAASDFFSEKLGCSLRSCLTSWSDSVKSAVFGDCDGVKERLCACGGVRQLRLARGRSRWADYPLYNGRYRVYAVKIVDMGSCRPLQ